MAPSILLMVLVSKCCALRTLVSASGATENLCQGSLCGSNYWPLAVSTGAQAPYEAVPRKRFRMGNSQREVEDHLVQKKSENDSCTSDSFQGHYYRRRINFAACWTWMCTINCKASELKFMMKACIRLLKFCCVLRSAASTRLAACSFMTCTIIV